MKNRNRIDIDYPRKIQVVYSGRTVHLIKKGDQYRNADGTIILDCDVAWDMRT